MANEISVRCNCRFWRFTGGKSKNPQAADDEKGIANAVGELCGIAPGQMDFGKEWMGNEIP